MSLDRFRALMSELGAGLGAPDMTPDEDGYIALTFDDVELHLQYEDDEAQVVAFTRLGEAEVTRSGQIYGMLLGANLFWQGTNGATFSIEPDSGLVFLADRHAVDSLSLERLNDWLENLLDTTVYWRKRLVAANAGGPLEDVELPSMPESEAAPTTSADPTFILRA